MQFQLCVAFVQVRIVLGPFAWYFPVDMLKMIPYFAVQIERWQGRRRIHLPSDTEFGTDLGMLIDVVRIANRVDSWEQLIPVSYQWMLKFIPLADYLGAECVLDDLAKFMGTYASKIDGTNPRGKVHVRVRNAYRMSVYKRKRLRSTGENCYICKTTMIPTPPNLPATFQLPCCKVLIHITCRVNWAKCPACDMAYTTIKCCVCLEDVQPLSPNFLDSWLEQRQFRTPCCYCDMHKECVDNFKNCAYGYQGFVSVCPLCHCPIDDNGGLRKELMEATDVIFQRRQQRINEEWRRNVADSVQPSPNFSGRDEWTGPLPRNVTFEDIHNSRFS